jgi:hypothetical protein
MENILTFRVCPEVVVFVLAMFVHWHTYAVYPGKGSMWFAETSQRCEDVYHDIAVWTRGSQVRILRDIFIGILEYVGKVDTFHAFDPVNCFLM